MVNPTGVGLKVVKKGERSGGRKPGTPNKTTQVLKDALINAAEALGYPKEMPVLNEAGEPTEVLALQKTGIDGTQGYLEWLGLNYPRTFATMLGRVLPLQLNIKTERSLKVTYKTVAETQAALKERGIEPSMVAEILQLPTRKPKP